MSLNRARLGRFQKILSDAGIDAYFACTPVSMGYLAEFFESPHERMMFIAVRPEGEPAMIAPALSETHASHTGIADIRTWSDGEEPAELFASLAADWGLKTGVLGVDDEMPASFLIAMQATLPAALFRAAGDEMARLRRVKEPHELVAMRRAAKVADFALAGALGAIKPGVTESEVASILFDDMRSRGGSPTF
ncbi:MAG: aminopeptidase P family N-terminal domain-containing protein, partial [Armatimonadota bacterium]|nr:aminopeptidase P family N-terminal domain-containing protein [Armatimonadota bacterium]